MFRAVQDFFKTYDEKQLEVLVDSFIAFNTYDAILSFQAYKANRDEYPTALYDFLKVKFKSNTRGYYISNQTHNEYETTGGGGRYALNYFMNKMSSDPRFKHAPQILVPNSSGINY